MNEVTGQSAAETTVGVETPRQPSAGELLRQAREDAGLHIAALAVALKVSVKKLEALEADRLDLLPDAVFVRAMASSVCRALKIDPAPVLDQLPKTAVPRLEFDEEFGLNTPFHAPGDVSRTSIWNQLSKPVVLASLVLLAGALVLIFFPSMEGMDIPGLTTSEIVEPALDNPAATAALPVAGNTTAVEAALPGRQTAPPVPKLQPAAAVVIPPPTSQAQSNVSSKVIVFRSRGPSWIEVTDGNGAVQISRTIDVGDVVGVSGALPLSVVVGRADVTDVQVRGKPFALDAVTKGNVAHFEVK